MVSVDNAIVKQCVEPKKRVPPAVDLEQYGLP